MYKVLVLEDEPPIRRYICRMVEKCSPHFRVIASGENGLEGLELFETYCPQLVITDVRMPGMSGLELIKELKSRGVQAHFLIISDYRDFEYARDSLKLGVYNYLTKPVIEAQMRENLDKLYQMIGEERNSRQKRLLDSLILGERQSEETEGLFDYTCFRMVLWQKGCVRNQYMQYLTDRESEQLLQERDIIKLEQRIRLRTNAEVIWTRGGEGNIVVFLLCFGERGRKTEELTEELFRGGEGYYTSVVSETFRSMEAFSGHYKSCLRTILYGTVLGQNSLLAEGETWKDRGELAAMGGKQLAEAVWTGDGKQVKAQLLASFDAWEQQRCPLVRIETELLEVFRQLSGKQQQAGAEAVPVQEYQQNLWEVIFYAQSMADLLGGTMDMLLKGMERFSVRETAAGGRQEEVLGNIERYIASRLEAVNSLQDISDRFQLSPTYICRLFRNYRAISFNEYLTGRKMEAACSMLAQGKSVREAANSLGYQDAYYFSKVFKKKLGMTPSEYKQQLS